MTQPSFINTETAPPGVAPYSHAVDCGDYVFITGQLPIHPANPEAPLPEGIEAQTRLTLQNLQAVLAAVGLDLSHVVQARVFITEFKRDYAAMNAVYASYFPSDRLPARTCIGVTGLARDALVEIDLVAKR
mgnify:CR=1 FL=1